MVTKSVCPPASAAGATTLLHAVKELAAHEYSLPASLCPVLEWPRMFIMKIDIEGHEFKALSSAIPWLSAKPPCFVAFEYTKPKRSSAAMVELFLDLGYDAAWMCRRGQFPMDCDAAPWWEKGTETGSKTLHEMIETQIKGTVK